MVVAQLRGVEFAENLQGNPGYLYPRGIKGVLGFVLGFEANVLGYEALHDVARWLGFRHTEDYLTTSAEEGRDILKRRTY